MSAPIRLAVFTPHPLVALGIATMVNGSGDRFVTSTFDGDGPEPDLALYDVALLHLGDSCLLDVLVERTATAVMLLGTALRPDLTARAIDRGADGFVDLDAPVEEVLAALESAITGWVDGDTGPNPTVGSSAEARAHLTAGDVGLSEREREILGLIAQGHSNHAIGAELFLGINTVKTHIRNAYAKIVVTSRSRAVAWAIEHGLGSS
jgi:DNA-binding NarL/FixJ family response regulator